MAQHFGEHHSPSAVLFVDVVDDGVFYEGKFIISRRAVVVQRAHLQLQNKTMVQTAKCFEPDAAKKLQIAQTFCLLNENKQRICFACG